MRIGIVGLGAAGKTSCFNALTGAHATTGGFGAGGMETHTGMLAVPDERLLALSELCKPKKTTHATIEFTDVPGLGGQGGFGRKALADLRDVDALLLVLRLFHSDTVPHPDGALHPVRDLGSIRTELQLADLEIVDKRLERIDHQIKKETKDKQELLVKEKALLFEIKACLENERAVGIDAAGRRILGGYGFFCLKPQIWLANVGDLTDTEEKTWLAELQSEGARRGCPVVIMNATLEVDLAEFPEAERKDYYAAVGLEGPAAGELIRTSYAALGLLSFFTAGDDECRAWTIAQGTLAPGAAGVIHSDLERGFIRADVVSYPDFMAAGSFHKAKEKGTLRTEGKSYEVRDGDVIVVHFSV